MGNQTRVNDLPDLGARNEIVADNIRATQVLYTAAMLEELKVFQVVDRLLSDEQIDSFAEPKPEARTSTAR